MNCKICDCQVELFDEAIVLNKYNVKYYKCGECGSVMTEAPYWLDEAYSDAITSSDIGLVSRNINFSDRLSTILDILFPKAKSFLDYGGGYGMFVRRMRDLGFDFDWFDEYCTNIFAKGHEKTKNHYDVITAFEMFEHLSSPHEMCGKLFSLSDNIIFSTVLVQEPTPKVNDWWYYGAEHGQHIFFYTSVALDKLAKKYGKFYSCIDGTFHIFSKEKINVSLCKKILCGGIKGELYRRLYLHHTRRESLLSKDFELLTGKKL